MSSATRPTTALWTGLGLVLLLTASDGLGGCAKSARSTPPQANAATEPTPAPLAPDEELIPPEKLEAVNTLLERKRFGTSRCVQAAQDAGQLQPAESIKVSVSFFVGTAGKAHDAKITEGGGRAAALETCLVEFIEGLTFEALPRDVEFSQTYYFSGV